jgi:multiple sugar transport system substrate-binding protein
MSSESDKQAPVRNTGRRKFLNAVGYSALGSFLIPRFAHAQKKHTLRILQWNHFVPQFDHWFDHDFVKKWSDANDTEVIIDRVGITSLNSRAQAEINIQKGHDLFMFLRPPSSYEDYVIDHREVYQECSRRYGKPNNIALKSTYNPKTKKYFGFADSYVPDPVNFRRDLWDDVGVYPDSWDNIRSGGARIYQRHGIPLGLGLAPELDSNMALRSLMHSFGASVQKEDGTPNLRTAETLDALRFMRALYSESIKDEVLAWDPSSNNRMMLAGHSSLTLNAISITRTGETQKIPLANRIALAPAAAGPMARIGVYHLMQVYTIWKFAQNIDGASSFLVDYIGQFRDAFLASKFYNFPCFPDTVPDIKQLLANDTVANPQDKYAVLSNAEEWTASLGYPGYANAVIDETFGSWIISTMFAEVARGRMKPEEALLVADNKVRAIHKKWVAQGKV